jgi:hypothetical protein
MSGSYADIDEAVAKYWGIASLEWRIRVVVLAGCDYQWLSARRAWDDLTVANRALICGTMRSARQAVMEAGI